MAGAIAKADSIAPQMLAELIDGRLTFAPNFEARSYSFSGTATFDRQIEGIIEENAKPLVWRARRDSNPRPTGSKPAALSS